MSEITPLFLANFQTRLNAKFSNAWARTLANLWYKKVTITQESETLTELFEWLLESAQIRPTGTAGAEIDFEDIAAVSFSLTNGNAGTALRLSRSSVEDNEFSRAAKWASDAGNSAAYWPQRQIVKLVQEGKVKLCYDGLPYFATNHPVNPFDLSLGTYSNLFTGKPLSVANLADICAQILTIPHPGDAPRYLKPCLLLVEPTNQLNAVTCTGAEIITDPLNANKSAPATNVIKTKYGFGEPVVVPELASEPGVWYLGCEADEDAFQGAFIYQERKPFKLTSYDGVKDSALSRLDAFEWYLRGRNTVTYGHPYLFFRIEP